MAKYATDEAMLRLEEIKYGAVDQTVEFEVYKKEKIVLTRALNTVLVMTEDYDNEVQLGVLYIDKPLTVLADMVIALVRAYHESGNY